MEKIAVFKFADEEYYYDPEFDILSIYFDGKMIRSCKLEEFCEKVSESVSDLKKDFLYELLSRHKAAYIFETKYKNDEYELNKDIIGHGWRIHSVKMPRNIYYELEKEFYRQSPEEKVYGITMDTMLIIEFDSEGKAVRDSIYDAIHRFEKIKKHIKELE